MEQSAVTLHLCLKKTRSCVTGGIVGARNKVLAAEPLIARGEAARNVIPRAYNTASYAGYIVLESSGFNIFSVLTKTQSGRFQIPPPVRRTFSKSSVFLRHLVGR